MADIREYGSVFINRELSWLKFNERVLEEAEDEKLPAFERLRFLSIYENNLDEFFMIRVGSLLERLMIGDNEPDNKSGMRVSEQLSSVCGDVRGLISRKEQAFYRVMETLKEHGVERVSIPSMTTGERAELRDYFESQMKPVLSPLIIDRHHPFPFLKGKDIYVVVELQNKRDFVKLGIVPLNNAAVSRVYFLPGGGHRFVLAEDMICHFAESIYKKDEIIDRAVVRVTRNADLDAEEALFDEEIDYRNAMEQLLSKRRKMSPVRLQLSSKVGPVLTSALCARLGIEQSYVFHSDIPLDFSFVSVIENRISRKLPELFNKSEQTSLPAGFDYDQPLLPQVLKRDMLLSYPYHSYRPFLSLLDEAADDKDVASIKITLYRVASESSVVGSLIRAAESGKEVCVVVELKARFDEENNIGWSRRLEDAGCTVVYGLDDYKIHSKLLLITRKGRKGIEFVTQVGTGNYNEITARLYTDLSLVTANSEIGREAALIFNSLLIGEKPEPPKLLWVAPDAFKTRISDLIDEQTDLAMRGEEARIVIKCNAVSDRALMIKLTEASRAGVKITMHVRGICCFRPGIIGHTDNITVKSIVGRLLEHARVYVFGTGSRRKIYIASGDMLTRNTERRVEVGAPILDPSIADYLESLLALADRDNVKARVMRPSGVYEKLKPAPGQPAVDSQMEQYKLNRRLYEEYRRNPRQTAPSGGALFTLFSKLKHLIRKK